MLRLGWWSHLCRVRLRTHPSAHSGIVRHHVFVCDRAGPDPSASAGGPRIYATLSAPPYQHTAAAPSDPLSEDGPRERAVEERPRQVSLRGRR